MRRFIAPIAVLPFLPLVAFAQNEMVVITGQQSMTGIWKFGPASPDIGSIDQYCRVRQTDDDLAWRCLPGGKWSGTLDGTTFHISAPGLITAMKVSMPGAWGFMDATLDAPNSFHGTMGFKLMGFSLFQSKLDERGMGQFIGRRLVLPATSPDGGGKAGLLRNMLEELAKGAIPFRRDLNQTAGFQAEPTTPEDIRPLGDVAAVIYLGDSKVRRWDPKDRKTELAPFVFNVYQVEFANGQRLCGIGQREDGVVDGFLCV